VTCDSARMLAHASNLNKRQEVAVSRPSRVLVSNGERKSSTFLLRYGTVEVFLESYKLRKDGHLKRYIE
jgi:hypothetical protein